ncbi:putative beta-galactosidase C [Colletotrichum orbiculare MAFF 240422]|uniref:Beta-galactosidase n=1 Tax=Colletotrichum orbiculare (strain 104-T / ATCC 96160 / CBS 514.97 / LARS 414 / MAFF 240422) TaxID=1213857 RepID=A0A484G3U1_COLOR|nr:putative beta-galactosidase C [Colletotrichum orbiculare MAFF 240422]
MRFFHVVAGLVWLLASRAFATDNGLTNAVTWDKYSLLVNDTRVFIYSAEFHYARLPVPELWPDVLQKFKANGFNTVSIYFFWSYHSAAEGVYDFETAGKNIQRLFDYCKEAGLYVIARAGPYCNAETNGGGLALWGSDGRFGKLRTSDERYHAGWLPFIAQVGKIIAANQITNGGPVILNQVENEYQETVYEADHTSVVYMEQLKNAFKDAGVVVPLTHNEKGMRSRSWSTDYQNVGGAINVYGLDSYPGALSCTDPTVGFNVVRTYYQWFQNYSFTQPSYLAEFEGGWFSNWGSQTFYDEASIVATDSPGLYMSYGGTNWGHSAAPQVYTSYDYSAPLRETREQWTKLFQTKLIGLFTRVSTDLLKVEMIGNGTGYQLSSASAFSWVLRNPDTQSGFTVIQQASTRSMTPIQFDVTLNTTAGRVSVPGVILNGRQSKILVTDYTFGKHTLLYASADIAAYGIFDTEVLVFYLQEGQTGEFAFKDEANLTFEVWGDTEVLENTNGNHTAFTYKQVAGLTAVKFSNGVLVYLLEQKTAWRFWAPATTPNPTVLPNEQLFIFGPYLVRSASVSHGVLHVSGDSDKAATLEAYVGNEPVETVDWNGLRLPASKTSYGSFTAQIPGAEDRSVALPELRNWRSADALPEASREYDDSRWVVCNKTATPSPYAPITLPVLYSSDYGFYSGAKIYRGYFDGANVTSVNMTASGGLAFGWSAWLNGQFLGGDVGSASATTTNKTLTLPRSALVESDNVLTVVVDYHGHDQASTAQGINNPRGLLGAQLQPGSSRTATGFKLWKLTGAAGGEANIDPVRGPMNEGGLHPERLGWHLPGFAPSGASWTTQSPLDGLSAAGIRFYVTSFTLNIDSDLDAPLGVELSASAGTAARVMLWINGYQYGKFVPHIGPQKRFPVPPGVLNNRGRNTIAISLWAQDDKGAKLDGVKLVRYGQYQTDFKFNRDWSYLQPGWKEGDRQQYA